jgi:hypothetical protein
MKTLLLDVTTWDYVVDANGNWAVADEPYALAQDVSSAIRLIKGDLWYDQSQGIPYVTLRGNTGQVLGKSPPMAVLQEYFVQAALTVPGVVSAVAVINSFNFATQQVTGQVQFTDSSGTTGTVAI